MKNNGIMKETFDVLELLYESYIKDNYTIGQNMANVNKVNLDIVLKDFEKFIEYYEKQYNKFYNQKHHKASE